MLSIVATTERKRERKIKGERMIERGKEERKRERRVERGRGVKRDLR